MGFQARVTILLVLACGISWGQQTPSGTVPGPQGQTPVTTQVVPPVTDPNADPRDNRQPALTPQELRDMQIRQFDPLDQTASPKTDANDTPGAAGTQSRDSAALPGSIAASQAAGPKVVGADDSTNSTGRDFTGPAVLSRAYTVNRPMMTQDVKWHESFGLGSTFNTAMIQPTIGSAGTPIGGGDTYGTTFSASLGGRRVFQRDQLGIDFSYQYMRSFPSYLSYSGPNLNLALDYRHIISRRLSVTLSQTASRFSQNYSQQNPQLAQNMSIADINIAASPNIQIFDLTTKQFASQADFTWEKSARLSFNFGVSYFAIVRDPTLIGNTGEQARGDFNYRLSRKTTVGTYYQHSHYAYQHGTGLSDTDTFGGIYSYAFSRSLQLRLRGGLSISENMGFTSVPLNPLIAALLGRGSIVVDSYSKYKSSDMSAQLIKDFRGGRTAQIVYAKGITPGNGVFQASVQETLSASTSLNVFRNYLTTFSAGRDSLSAVSQAYGKYTNENVQISITRLFRRGFRANFQASYRYFDVTGQPITHNQVFLSSGVTWSPAEGRLWPF